MKVCYRSYMEFILKADVLSKELALSPEQSAELLARISGYDSHATMPLGQTGTPAPTHEDLVIRLLAIRNDICIQRAGLIVDRLRLPLS
jgi:hypothetical protein